VAWAIIDPHYFFSGLKGYVALAAVVLFLVQAVVYVPRAVLAARRQ
jgi:uncharacterized membrane protein YtjA (UPF0391 family)